MPASASLASLPAWPMDDRGLKGMTEDRQRERETGELKMCRMEREGKAKERAKERGRQKDCE